MSVYIPSSGGAPSGIIECRYAVNTNSAGASISADTWTALPITEFLDTNGHCSVSAGVMTLQAGTYRGFISCTQLGSVSVNPTLLRLRNTSDSVSPIKTETFNTNNNASYPAPMASKFGAFVIGASKNFQLEILYDLAATIGIAASGTLSDAGENLLATVYLEKIA